MDPPAKGTVTPLATLFSSEEAFKAASHVEEKIGEKRSEMNRLQEFVNENDNLINLVKKLPDQLHHKVMVPFGKMAFFPGRLSHTNECLVLLGENYYTYRTSKQTIEVLKRRDKTLQSQIDSLKAEIKDFQTEASFFSTTATEAAEGIVEIREEYVEEDSCATTVLQSSEKEPSGGEGEVDDDEFARIMSRLNELEIEEELEDEEHDFPTVTVEEKEHKIVKGLSGETEQNRITGQEATYAVSRAKTKANIVGPQKTEAFTGSIVEHAHNLETNTQSQMQSSGSQPSKPVSRFKAQRR